MTCRSIRVEESINQFHVFVQSLQILLFFYRHTLPKNAHFAKSVSSKWYVRIIQNMDNAQMLLGPPFKE